MTKQPYKCPVCHGRGLVSLGFYQTATGVTTGNPCDLEDCRSCDGKGIIFS